MNPLISIIIPAYNREKQIAAALQSIQAQTYQNWEAIVVDDASKDRTCEVVSQMAQKDGRIRLLRHEQNRRAQAARNTGIRAAKGEWVAFLDSDDEYLPNSLADRLAVAQKENVPVVHSDCYILKPGEEKQLYKIRPWVGNIYKKVLEREGPMFQGLLVKKEALEAIGLLDENIKAYQEWDTSIRLAKSFKFGFCPNPTFVYDYRTDDAMSRNHLLNAQGYTQIVQKHFGDMLKHTGFRGIGRHHEVIGRWYEEGQDKNNAKRHILLGKIWKMMSPSIVAGKIKNVLAGK